jgi:hypothetical protein
VCSEAFVVSCDGYALRRCFGCTIGLSRAFQLSTQTELDRTRTCIPSHASIVLVGTQNVASCQSRVPLVFPSRPPQQRTHSKPGHVFFSSPFSLRISYILCLVSFFPGRLEYFHSLQHTLLALLACASPVLSLIGSPLPRIAGPSLCQPRLLLSIRHQNSTTPAASAV